MNGNILLNSALPSLSDADGLSINGGTSKITVKGNSVYGIFDIPAGVAVTLQNLTIANGRGNGGIIHNAGTLNLQASTLTGGMGTLGGALYNTTGMVNITNSTFTLNSADFGAAIFNDTGTVIITNSTFNDNTITGGGTGVIYNNGFMTLRNTIVTDGNGGSLCAGNAFNFASTNNLSEVDASCVGGFTVVALGQLALGPLASNGGSTETFALLPDSVAINAGNNSACPATDQRGIGRPQGALCDVGSFEAKISLSVSPTSLVFTGTVAGTPSLPKTVTVTNSGEANLMIGLISITGEFAIVNDLCSSAVVAPTNNCTFDVTFTPLTTGSKSGVITLPSNILASPTTIAVSGSGVNGTNMILNPGFEYPYKQPIGWKNPGAPYTLNSVVDKFVGYNSCCSLRLPGKSRLYYIYQGVSSAGKAGNRFMIGLSSMADNITLVGPSDVYMGQVIFQDTKNRPTETFTFLFTPGTHGWERQQYTIVTTMNYYNFVFKISVRSPTGVAWFDNAMVMRLP